MEESQESKGLGDSTCLSDFHVTLYSRVTPYAYAGTDFIFSTSYPELDSAFLAHMDNERFVGQPLYPFAFLDSKFA